MITKILIFVICSIILYDMYLTYNITNSSNTLNNVEPALELLNKNTFDNNIIKIPDIVQPLEIHKDIIKILPYEKKHVEFENNGKEVVDTSYNITKPININMYGTPSSMKENEYIIWTFYEPKPWTKIIYKYHVEYPFYFFIKIKIPSLNDYENWKKIITNLEFNPSSGDIIIPAKDEETALAIANLIISNFNDNISLSDIINKDLIGISIMKTKKHENIKNKIREQIMNSYKSKSIVNNNMEFQTDLAINNNYYSSVDDTIDTAHKNIDLDKNESIDDFTPWEGSEFSFI